MNILSLIIPIIGTGLYLSLDRIKPQLVKIPNNYLRTYNAYHNVSLSFFSLYIFLYLSYVIFVEKGIHFQHHYYLNDTKVVNAIGFVYASKYYEYMDTVFLLANKKTPIFLQKFHHVGAVWIWYLAYQNRCDFIVYSSWLNCMVHTVMYAYYLFSMYVKVPKYVKQTITTLQIGQLTVGLVILPYAYSPFENRVQWLVMQSFACYVMCLLVLFSLFMWNTYRVKTG